MLIYLNVCSLLLCLDVTVGNSNELVTELLSMNFLVTLRTLAAAQGAFRTT